MLKAPVGGGGGDATNAVTDGPTRCDGLALEGDGDCADLNVDQEELLLRLSDSEDVDDDSSTGRRKSGSSLSTDTTPVRCDGNSVTRRNDSHSSVVCNGGVAHSVENSQPGLKSEESTMDKSSDDYQSTMQVAGGTDLLSETLVKNAIKGDNFVSSVKRESGSATNGCTDVEAPRVKLDGKSALRRTVNLIGRAGGGCRSRSKDATDSSDPVELPDDLFESAAALQAEEEEEDRLRREINQQLQEDDDPEEISVLDDADILESDDAAAAVRADSDGVAEDQELTNGSAMSCTGSPADEATDDSVEPMESAEPSEVETVDEVSQSSAAMDEESSGKCNIAERVEEVLADSLLTKSAPELKSVSEGRMNGDLSVETPVVGSSLPTAPAAVSGVSSDNDDVDEKSTGAKRKRVSSPASTKPSAKLVKINDTQPQTVASMDADAVSVTDLVGDSSSSVENSSSSVEQVIPSDVAEASCSSPPEDLTAVAKQISRMSRQELEALVLQKMCETVASRSIIGRLRKTVENNATSAERFQKKTTLLQKQVGDLHQVVKKLSNELRIRSGASYPVKITRTVGLQVMLARGPTPAAAGTTAAGRTAAVIRQTRAPTPVGAAAAAAAGMMNGGGVRLRLPFSPGAAHSPRPVTPVQRASVPTLRRVVPGSPSPISGSPDRRRLLSPRAVATSVGAPVQRSVLASALRPQNPPKRGRPPKLHPLPSPVPSSSADVVDLTDDTPSSALRQRGSTVMVVASGMAGQRLSLSHPAPFPITQPNPVVNTGQLLPPPPILKVTRKANGIVLSWTLDLTPRNASIVSYHLFAYQEAFSSFKSNPWKKVGDVKALPLPMACTLTQFQEGHKYHFAVRAEDSFRRRGPFSNASSISLLTVA